MRLEPGCSPPGRQSCPEPRRRKAVGEPPCGQHAVDVSDQLVDGGIMDRGTIGINWWATRRWKIGFDYGGINPIASASAA